MKTPTHLKHKPIVSVDCYSEIDGKYANATDAKALSIGYAQYRESSDAESEISLKVFRYVNKWSRLSEELPIHRVLDLAILFLRTIVKDQEIILVKSALSERMNKGFGLDEIFKFCRKNKEFLLPRIEELKYLLNTVNYRDILA